MDKTRQYILDIFKKRKLQAGYYIDMKWINSAYREADIDIQKHFDEVLQQMINEDFLECKEGHGNTLFLTQKGEDALMAYIEERDANMSANQNSVNINVNPVISPVFNQTNTQTNSNIATQTQSLDIKTILQEQLDTETYNKLEEIITSHLSQQEKKSKIGNLLGSLGANVLSTLLTNFINSCPWS